MKKKILLGTLTILISANLVFNYSNELFSRKMSLSSIIRTASAETEFYYDSDGGSFWDKIWDNTFNKDWTQVEVDCYDDYGLLYDVASDCDTGDDDVCSDTDCK